MSASPRYRIHARPPPTSVSDALPLAGESAPLGDPDGDLGGLLRRIVATARVRSAACIEVIGFDSLKRQIPDTWLAVRAKVQLLLERLLTRALDPEDSWQRCGEETYVVVFGRRPPAEAEVLCRTVMQQLMVLLLGTPETASLGVKTVLLDPDAIGGAATLPASALRPVVVAPHGAMVEPAAAASRFRYQPVWDTRQQVISTHICRPWRTGPDGAPLWDHAVLDDRTPSALVALDRATLAEATGTMDELFANRFRLMVSMPVHFETLATPGRRRDYLDRCVRIPDGLGAYLLFILHGIPTGVPEGTLAEIVATLRHYGRGVLAHTGLDTGAFASLAAAGVGTVGTDLAAAQQQDRALPAVARYLAAAKRVRLRTYLGGIRDPRLALGLEAGGADFLYGPGIALAADVPDHMLRFTDSDLRRRSRH